MHDLYYDPVATLLYNHFADELLFKKKREYKKKEMGDPNIMWKKIKKYRTVLSIRRSNSYQQGLSYHYLYANQFVFMIIDLYFLSQLDIMAMIRMK